MQMAATPVGAHTGGLSSSHHSLWEWWFLLHPWVPSPTCHNPPKPLHQLDGCSHGAPSFNPLVHEKDAQTWRGQRLWMSAPCPHWQPPQKGSTPHAHLVRWHRCGPPSPSPGPSSRCRAVPLSAHRGARPCGWPGSLSAAWQQLQHLEVGTALSGPPGTRDRDPALTCDLCPAHPG